MKILAERIKYQRELSGETQIDLAKAIQVNQSAISFWEQDINEPKATYLKELCLHFNVSADYLLGITDIF